jgi:glycerate dehydrogenase
MTTHNETIVFLDAGTVGPGIDLRELAHFGEYREYFSSSQNEVIARASDATVVVTNKVVLDEAILSALPRLKFVQVFATGMNNVDLDAASRLGITVRNVAGYSTFSTAQHAFTLILTLFTGLDRYLQDARRWHESPFFTMCSHPIEELRGKTLGIVGAGAIGSQVARFAAAFEMRVLAWARSDRCELVSAPWPRLPLPELVAESDVVSLHVPLTRETESMIDTHVLQRFKRGAFLVNTARGGLIDEVALVEALRSGRLGGAALDVLRQEPPKPDHPLLDGSTPNVLVTPHIAWASSRSRQALFEGVLHNLKEYIARSRANAL